MTDIYLKASSAKALYTALEAAGVVTEGEDGWHVTDGHRYALDVIGTIYAPTGKMLDTDLGEVPETKPLRGYHANLRVLNGDAEALTKALGRAVIEAPSSPSRGWA